jgi:hypothetical protein
MLTPRPHPRTITIALAIRVPHACDAKRRCKTWYPAAALVLAACSGLTDVRAPDIVQPSDLANAAGAEARRAGTLSAFAMAYAGPIPSQVAMSGLVADEFATATQQREQPARIADSRVLPEPGGEYPYDDVQRTRVAARDAIAALRRYAPQTSSRIAELFAIAGYTEVFLGENMCSGIPLGEVVDSRPVFGQPLTTPGLFERAVVDFDSALTYAADSARIANLARVGRGRALVNLARFREAAMTIATVPTFYLYTTEHGTSTQNNGVFDAMNMSLTISVANREGVNGLDFRSAADPRVPTRLVGRGADGRTDVYAFTRYTSLASPVPLATGVEARLIEAEAALRDGDSRAALNILNALRATTRGLLPLADAGTDPARINQLFRERAFWLFATGHRQGDLRRLVRQYERPAESVFPTGPFGEGFTYGTDVNFAPSASQRSSPLYSGCQNRMP